MRRIFLICMLLAAACDLHAQGNATFHVFPQIADGIIVGGTTLTGYVSSVLVTNTSNQSSNCTIQLYGSGLANRLPGSSFTLDTSGSSIFLATTLGSRNIQPLATGYSTLTCSQPVAAAVLYAYVSLAGVLSAATVFSSPPATRAQLFDIGGGSRLAFALANDTDASAQYQLALVTPAGQTVTSTTLTVAARSNVAKFIDEVFTPFPPNFTGAFTATSSGSAKFSLLGLIFMGDLFTSEPAAILAQ